MKMIPIWLLIIGTCISNANAGEQRRHYKITSSGQKATVLYNVTEILSTDAKSTNLRLYLLQDSNGDRLVLTETADPRRNEITREIRDLATNEYVRSTVSHSDAVRKDVAVERQVDPAATPQVQPGEDSVPLQVELNGIGVLTTRKEALSREWRESRSKLRRAAGPAFMERLERMRGIPASAEILSGFCEHVLRFVLYNDECTSKLTVAPAAPDCDFDAQFRYPCTDAQKKAIKRMPKVGALKY